MDLFFLQLLSYSALTWLAFAAIATATPYFLRWRWIPVGHLLVALIVYYLDVAWVQEQMKQPDWDGAPDLDIVFWIGLLPRILLINTVLLPFTLLGAWLHSRKDCPRIPKIP
jgi:hypothetical protein